MRKALLRILASRYPVAFAKIRRSAEEAAWRVRARQCGWVMVRPAPDRFAFSRLHDESQRLPLHGDIGRFQVEGFLAEREAGN